MKYNRKNTIERMHTEKVKFLHFWGHQPAKDGSITSSCLSQWWVSPFEVEAVVYKTAEHWMMAGKAKLFGDDEMLKAILQSKSPAEAKAFGRKVKGFDPDKWNESKFEIVKQGSIHKFNQDEDLKEFLLNTKNRILVEASPRDRIWGIGMSKNHEHASNPEKWRGQNLLGFALMEARDELKNGNK